MANQAQIFYNTKWSRFDDNSFLTNLEFFAYMEKRPICKDDREIMMKVRDWLNPKKMWYKGNTFDPMPVFSLSDIYRMFEFAEMRYNTWKHIIGSEGVTYNQISNTINLTTKAMVEICEKESYLFEPEYKWKELQKFFGPYQMSPTESSKSSQNRTYSRMLEELLADIGEDRHPMDEDDSSTDEKIQLSKIKAPDVMSTTKGKSHILHDPVAKMISPHLRKRPHTDDGKTKATCSYAVKHFLKF